MTRHLKSLHSGRQRKSHNYLTKFNSIESIFYMCGILQLEQQQKNYSLLFINSLFFSRNQINNLCAVYNNNERPKSGFFVCYMLPASSKLHFFVIWGGWADGMIDWKGMEGKIFFIRRKSKFFENIKLLVHFQPLPLSYVLQPRLLLKICASNWWIPFKSLDSKDNFYSRINKTLSLKNFIKIWWPLCQNFSFF